MWGMLIPAIASLVGGIIGKKKQKGITSYPQFGQMTNLVNQQQARIKNTEPLYDALIQMTMGRLPGYMQGNENLQSFRGLSKTPGAQRMKPVRQNTNQGDRYGYTRVDDV